MKRTTARAPRVLKQPPRKGVAQRDEHGHERPGIIICPDCGNVHYHKRWWKNSDSGLKKLVVMHYRTAAHTRCPACTMAHERLFEGEVIIENIPRKFKIDLRNLIDRFGLTATEMDPQDRIMTMDKSDSEWRITTSENQLADRLAKKIRDSFKHHTQIHISHSKEPYEVDRVKVAFT